MLEIFYSLKIHATILFEPFVASLVIWENAEHFVVEVAGMIHVAAVAEFVNHYAVQNFWRHEHKQTVEVEVSVYRAAAPAGLLQADKDSVVGNAGEFCVVLYPLRNHYPRLFLNLLDIFFGERAHGIGKCGLLFYLFHLLGNPVFLFFDEVFGDKGRSSKRHFHDDFFIICHMDTH